MEKAEGMQMGSAVQKYKAIPCKVETTFSLLPTLRRCASATF